jgi:ubiquinone/menaquinone biosynthesis C-methylase UbiE
MADPHATPATRGAVIHWASRYDLLVWLLTLGREPLFRQRVIGLARVAPGEAILDVGCGTGTLAIVAKRLAGPNGSVHGVDASPEMIARARMKAKRAGIEVEFATAVAETLPFQDARFDVVLTSMVIHHLPRDERQRCFREMRRVLKPGGRLLAVDFGSAGRKRRGPIAHFHRRHRFDLFEVIPMLSEAGLNDVESGAVGFGGLQFVRAVAG